MFYTTVYHSPIGPLTLLADETHLVGVWLAGQKHFCASYKGPFADKADSPVLQKSVQWLQDYFAGLRPPVSAVPLAPQGSPFRKRVWQILCEIPYGRVLTYGAIAQRLAQEQGLEKMSAQAVGGAVGHNPISIIIPCHRVVGANGSLTGYAGGLTAKRWLLTHEGVTLKGRSHKPRLQTGNTP